MSIPTKPTVFISYSHKDEHWKDLLLPQLRALEQAGRIVIWEDRKINGGDKWYREIKHAMQQAAVAVCLISPDYLASDFSVKEEVPYLLKRCEEDGMILIPVLLRPCAWKAFKWLKEIQMLPRDGKSVIIDFKGSEDAVFANVANLIFDIIERPTEYEEPTPHPRWPLPKSIDIDRLPVTGAELFGREKELAMLDQAWESNITNIISLVAWGGVGKSTLVNKWLEEMRIDNYRGARRVYAWSFYSQGLGERVTSAELFIKDALMAFGDTDMTTSSPSEKGKRLASLIQGEKTLLVLDGLEPLQSHYRHERGKINDPALGTLLHELANNNPGLCLITTREPLSDLEQFRTTVLHKDLDQISDEAGRALLRVGGVQGTDVELERTTRQFGNHALAINLLAVYLHDIPLHRVSNASEIPDVEIPEAAGKHPRRVITAIAQRFGERPEVELLRVLGLFDRPADNQSLAALRAAPKIPALTEHLQSLSEADWMRLIEKLRRMKLVALPGRHGVTELDAHPIVREHFKEELKQHHPVAWREGNNRLYEYLKLTTQEVPDSIEEIAPLLAAVAHGCEAGRHEEALQEVYWPRIDRSLRTLLDKKADAVALEVVAPPFFTVVEPIATTENASNVVAHKVTRHPKGLYVLSAAVMCERFSFYIMLSLFALYMRDTTGRGFAWGYEETVSLVSIFLMSVHMSPLIGGWIADKTRYRKVLMISGLSLFFGHSLLCFRSLVLIFPSLICLVIGIGLFKPSISTMVGNLYSEGSHFKDRAYNIFYLGTNVAAFLAPIVAHLVLSRYGFHPAFAVAAGSMMLSVLILWKWKNYLEYTDRNVIKGSKTVAKVDTVSGKAGIASRSGQHLATKTIADWKRVSALLVFFLLIMIFWMYFHQFSLTTMYWGYENTNWNDSGIISNMINPAWVIILTLPLIGFWNWLDKRGLEPSTPMKMVTGMVLTALGFVVFFIAAEIGESSVAAGAGPYDFKMSPAWLIGAYGVLTLGELMLVPMGLALVSNVAPVKMRGVMMGGWFVTIAIGNRLTLINPLWDDWLRSKFFLFLSLGALLMAGVMLVLLRALEKAIPEVLTSSENNNH